MSESECELVCESVCVRTLQHVPHHGLAVHGDVEDPQVAVHAAGGQQSAARGTNNGRGVTGRGVTGNEQGARCDG